MNVIRNIKIRAMVVLIQVFSTLAWISVAGATLWLLHNLKQQLALSPDQLAWINMAQLMLMLSIAISIAITLFTERYLWFCLVKPVNTIRNHMHVLARGELATALPDLGRNCIGLMVPPIQQMQDNWE